MADTLLIVIVGGVLLLALGVDFAVLVSWLQGKWWDARR
jgi:hypothetical protein